MMRMARIFLLLAAALLLQPAAARDPSLAQHAGVSASTRGAVRTLESPHGYTALEPHAQATRTLLMARNKPQPLKEPKQPPGVNKGNGNGNGGLNNGKRLGHQDRTECTTHVIEEKASEAANVDVRADAIALAFVEACHAGAAVHDGMFDRVFNDGYGGAFATASAQAFVTCESSHPHGYECDSITAASEAWAVATASVHAEAVATAVHACGCNNPTVAESWGSASLYGYLVAKATASATASVCVDGKGVVSDSSYASCTSWIVAYAFAEAVAGALVEGSCNNADAVSKILTKTTLELLADNGGSCGVATFLPF